MTVVTEGLTKTRIADMVHSFYADGLTSHRGIPYIYGLNLQTLMYVTGINSNDVLTDYRILRPIDAIETVAKTKSAAPIADLRVRKSLPDLSAGKYPIGPCSGYRKTGVGFHHVSNLDNFLGAGGVIFTTKITKSGTWKTIPIDFNLPINEKLIGIIPRAVDNYLPYNNELILITVATSGDITDGSVYTTCKWRYWFPDTDFIGGITNSNTDYFGDVVGSITKDTFGFGRSAVIGTTCGVAEFKTNPLDEGYIWTANGDTDGTVQLWKFNSTDSSLEMISSLDSTEGITDGSAYPAKPAIYLFNDNAIIICGNIVYSYKRATIASAGYDDTAIDMNDVFITETLSTGLFDNSTFSIKTDEFDEKIYAENAETITGCVISGVLRDTFEKANDVLSLEVLPKGYGVLLQRNKDTSVATIPWGKIGAVEGSDSERDGGVLNSSRVMNTELPRSVTLNYKDPYRLYSETQSQAKYNTAIAMTDEIIEIPFFITKSAADYRARNILLRRWIERDTYEITLPFTYVYLELGDIITIYLPFENDFTTLDCRIVKRTESQNGVLTLALVAHRNSYFYPDNIDGSPDDLGDGEPVEIQYAESVFLDIPAVDYYFVDSNAVPMCAFPTNDNASWDGAKIKLFKEEELSSAMYDYTTDFPSTTRSVVGVCADPLPESDGTVVYRGTPLSISLIDPMTSLESVSDMFNTETTLFAYGSELNGWEICKYETATLIDADTNTYELSNIARGLYGTESLTANHVDGDTFVLLANLTTLSLRDYTYNTLLYGKTVASGQSDESVLYREVSYAGVNWKPYSGCHAVATRNGLHDITVEWKYRSRYDNEWVDEIDTVVSDLPEKYEIDVLDSGIVVRTITVNTPSFTYYADDQTDDFGTWQPSIHFAIYQVSAVVGRGTAYEVTL